MPNDNEVTIRAWKPARILWLLCLWSLCLGRAEAQQGTTIIAVAAGYQHTLALRYDGTVWACGLNADGELGNGTTTESLYPTQIPGLTNVIAIAAGYAHSLALKSDGTVWAWGYNASDQLGHNQGTDGDLFNPGILNNDYYNLMPRQVSGLSGVVAIGAGYEHSIALKSDGTVWTWGDNYWGELGNGKFQGGGAPTPTPVEVIYNSGSLTGITAISAGGYHNLALRNDGTVWAWGQNYSGQVGNDQVLSLGAQPPGVDVATQVVGIHGYYGYLTGITAIAAGGEHSLALDSTGAVWAWGGDGYGQLGNDQYGGNFSVPASISGLPTMTGIGSGPTASHSLSLSAGGAAWAWGDDTSNQLGIFPVTLDSAGDLTVPAQVTGPNDTGYLTGIATMAGGNLHSLAIDSTGTAWGWGDSSYGQLGVGVMTQSNWPIPILGLNLPALQSLAPASTFARSPNVTVTINGSSFLPGAVAYWYSNGYHFTVPLATTYVSSLQVTALIPASLLGAPGTAEISVLNSATQVGSPPMLRFTIVPIPHLGSPGGGGGSLSGNPGGGNLPAP